VPGFFFVRPAGRPFSEVEGRTNRHCHSVATGVENPCFFAPGEADQWQQTRCFFVLDLARTRGPRLENRRQRKLTEGSNPSLSASSNGRQSLVGPRGVRPFRVRSSVDSGDRTGGCTGNPHDEQRTGSGRRRWP